MDVDVKNFNGLIENFRFGIKFGLKVLKFHKNFGFNVELTALDDVFIVSIETSDLDLSNGKAKIHFKCDLGRRHINLFRGPVLAVLTRQKRKLNLILGPNALNHIYSLWNGLTQ